MFEKSYKISRNSCEKSFKIKKINIFIKNKYIHKDDSLDNLRDRMILSICRKIILHQWFENID